MTKTVRFRVRHGRLEPLEPVSLIEGSEVEAVVPVEETRMGLEAPRSRSFRSWNMGVKEPRETWDLGPMSPLTREQIYEDVWRPRHARRE